MRRPVATRVWTNPVGSGLRCAAALEARSPKLRAWLDICGLTLPLIATWILVVIAIPSVIFNVLTDDFGRPITDDRGHPITTDASRKSLAVRRHYFEWVVSASLLITFGTIIQARQPLTVKFGTGRQGMERPLGESSTTSGEPEG